jgi:hypothetical protein
MTFHVSAWGASQGSTTLANIAGLADGVMQTSGNNITSFGSILLGLYAVGANMTRAQFTSATLRKLAPIEIEPFDAAAAPANPPTFNRFDKTNTPINPGEALQALTAASAAAQNTVVAFVADKVDAIPPGPIFTTRATGTTTLVANAWTNVALTYDQSLDVGTYAIVGMRARSAGGIAARIVFQNQGARPGTIARTSASHEDIAAGVDRWGGYLGAYGTFVQTNPPSVDFLSSSADTSETILFDLVKAK